MTKKPYSPKHGKDIPHQKRIEELAADDYVERARGDNFSDSDILAPQGVTVKTSDNESREDGASKTLAQDEAEEHERRVENLEKQPLDWLHERAEASGIEDWKQLSKNDLVQRLSENSAPAH
ncbi:MAG TPA: hypothetical protein VE954_12600 [Oligoflexus sp.]|uniref:hypothetical protein n=1 Tax=Oligoflexus sp. TaxID=1971216 RepID=UPI002D648B00|nr:hypothetical protein [Oligoflexus sp.]HYX33947.1 hypothetical protein [Oligoflexus sp.]